MRYADATLSYGLIEMLLVFGVVLAFAVWELVSVRRSMKADKARQRDERSRDGEPPKPSP